MCPWIHLCVHKVIALVVFIYSQCFVLPTERWSGNENVPSV